MDIAGGRNRQPFRSASWVSTAGLERQEPLQSGQIAVAQVGSAVGHPDFALKLLGGVKQPIGVNQEVGALFARRSGLDRIEHAKLEFVLKQGVENLETDSDPSGRGAVDEARDRSEPFEDFGLLGRALRTRERGAEVFFE